MHSFTLILDVYAFISSTSVCLVYFCLDRHLPVMSLLHTIPTILQTSTCIFYLPYPHFYLPHPLPPEMQNTY